MNKVYNIENEIAISLSDFFKKIDFKLSKPQKKIIPHILNSIILAENITTSDLYKVFIDDSFLSNDASIQKKLWRFFNNPKFNGNNFFHHCIKNVIYNLKCIKNNKLVVIFDHMYIKNNFVILMFSLKVGTCSIPLLFKCDKTKSNRHFEIDELTKKRLFSEKVIFKCIDEVIDLLNDLNTPITFLADRWFCNLKLMKYISDKGHYFCIRAKVNSNIKFLIYDKKEKHHIYKNFNDLPNLIYHSTYYKDIPFGSFGFKCNLSISRTCVNKDDPWYILSNIEPNKAIREYSKRFGGIEMLFKNQKTNGFNLEKTKTKNLHALENLYSLTCLACVWCTILGADYTKNKSNVKNKLNIRFMKKDKNGKPIRILSLFNLGLTIYRRVYNSFIDYKIKCNFVLYL